MTYWSGLIATGLLMLALAITPFATLFGWARLIDVRRNIGVSALAYTVAHLFIYFALRFWNFASIAHEMLTRVSLILATIATIGMVALGATSFDEAIRRIGAKSWQQLHNAIYVIGALAVVHYLLSPDIYPEQYLMSGIFCWLMLWRALKLYRLQTNIAALTVIAIVSAVFTALLEIFWIWAYQGYSVSEVLSIYFTFDLGTPLEGTCARALDRVRSGHPADAVLRRTGSEARQSWISLPLTGNILVPPIGCSKRVGSRWAALRGRWG